MDNLYREIKLGDHYRGVRAELQDANRQPVDLRGKVVKFKARRLADDGAFVPVFESEAVVESDGADGEKAVVYFSPAVQWFTSAGVYFCDFKVYSGTDRESFPENDLYMEINVLQD